MTVKCPSCGALHWMDECLSSSSKRNPKFGKCCLSGKIQLPELMPPPQPLKRLLESSDTDAKEFRNHIQNIMLPWPLHLWEPNSIRPFSKEVVPMPYALLESFIISWEHCFQMRIGHPLMPNSTSMTQLRQDSSG